MKCYLQGTIALIAVFSVSTIVKASGGSNSPHYYDRKSFAGTIETFSRQFVSDDVNKNNSGNAPKSTTKICACQVLSIHSTNYNHTNMVLLAEKTNNGDLSSDASRAKGVLESEKKHLKNYFYKKIKVEQMLVDGTDCKSLFKKLKAHNNELVLYEILDADIRK